MSLRYCCWCGEVVSDLPTYFVIQSDGTGKVESYTRFFCDKCEMEVIKIIKDRVVKHEYVEVDEE